MAKIYTGTGDAGQTSLYSGERVPKCSARVEAYGAIDELQAQLGFARALATDKAVGEALFQAETLLVGVMAQLADLRSAERITADDTAWVEAVIDEYAPREFSFRVPGGDAASAALHGARAVARRAERRVLQLHAEEPLAPDILRFINRLSDMCWALACRLEDEAEAR